MGYSRAVRSSVLKKVLPPDGRSIVEVSRETGINDQTIRNWIKKSESGILPDGSQESSPRFMTPKEKYQLVLEAAGIDNEQLGLLLQADGEGASLIFLRHTENPLHSAGLPVLDKATEPEALLLFSYVF